MRPIPNIPNSKDHKKPLVDAENIAKDYSVTSRYILKLAAEGRIPCIRMGRKCVRFDASEVAKSIAAMK